MDKPDDGTGDQLDEEPLTVMEFLLPQPDSEGIAQTQELYLRKYGRTLTSEEAAEALGKVMRYLFLVNNPSASNSN